MTGVEQRVVVEPHDGSLGPLLRAADDRLGPGESYGAHEHRAVDVVAVVLAGSLTHAWGDDGTAMSAGDVGVLRAGTGLRHDERAGPDGARVLQCYLRPADPDTAAAHDVVRGAAGWIDLGRPDARLWLGSTDDAAPDGLVVTPEGSGTVVVWRLDAARPAWAD